MLCKSFWEKSISPPSGVVSHIEAHMSLLAENSWTDWSPTPPIVLEAHTDSSLTAWAFTSESGTQWGHFPVHLRSETIEVKELYALVRQVEWWLDNKHVGTPARLRIRVDNTVVIGAWRRLFSLKLSLLDLLIGL